MATAVAIAGIVGGVVALVDFGWKTYDKVTAPVPIPDPTLAEIITPYIPQVLIVIIAIILYLMYSGIIKHYKKHTIIFIYPIASALVYLAMLVVLFLINSILNIPVIIFALDVIITIYYVMLAISIYKGKKDSKKVWIKK